MTTEELEALGLTKEQAKAVFALRGQEIAEQQKSVNDLTAEKESYKSQVEQLQAQIDDLKAKEGNSEELQNELDKITKDFEDYKSNSATELEKTIKTNAIQMALKDSKALDTEILMSLLDIDGIQLDEAGKPQLDSVLGGLKESKPFLFEAEDAGTEKSGVRFIEAGNPSADDSGKYDPFEAAAASFTAK